MIFFTRVWVAATQVSRILLSVQADLNSALVWVVSICLRISNSSWSFTNPLVTVPRAPNTIGILVTFMVHNFFQFPNKVLISYHFPSILHCGLPGRQSKKFGKFSGVFFCFFLCHSLDLVDSMRFSDPFVYQNLRELIIIIIIIIIINLKKQKVPRKNNHGRRLRWWLGVTGEYA